MTNFPSIKIEGGLLGPDLFEQLVSGDLAGQKPSDFYLSSKQRIADEAADAFTDARALWGVFQNRLARLPENDLATTVTRDAWVIPFLGLLGYRLQFNQRAYTVDEKRFEISHRAGIAQNDSTDVAEDALPVHIVGYRQELGRLPASGRPRMAPHSLVQEFLNRTEHLWSVVTNGRTLRVLRDCTFVRRQAYVEFDLQAMLEEQRFQDFNVLFRLIHRSRFPRGVGDANECWLEKYYQQSVEQGGRVRDHLRDGVEECIKTLANGFLGHTTENEDLRRRVRPDCGTDRITPESLYRQLLKLVYRFLFLLVSEDRGLLSSDPLYRDHYGVARLRRLAELPSAFTDDDDIWRSLQVLWKTFAKENLAKNLHLAPLNGELFQWQDLDAYLIQNKMLLKAFKYISLYQEKTSGWRRVNYGALDVEELGSVYESLLDYHPEIIQRGNQPPKFDLAFGSERKTTGSYYTPPQLVDELIKSALEPVIEDRLAAHPKQPEKAILSIRVCDPACGSGHFLLAAARRLGKELARVRSGEEEPAPECVREAVRDVISHCIYGVDKNPLAVDLCRVALWLESHTGGKPLTFLDHRIRCGDSLVGVFDLDVLRDGIPDNAFTALEGDDPETAKEYKQINRNERKGGFDSMFGPDVHDSLQNLTAHSLEVDRVADDTADAVHRKKELYYQSHYDERWSRLKTACDLYAAAFFQPLVPGDEIITTSTLAEHLGGRPIDARLKGVAERYSVKERFFHWPLEFPEAFAAGGFDVVLSNPPWERVKLQEQEFFAVRDADIAQAPNKAVRERLIRQLPKSNPDLHQEFVKALRAAAGASSYMRHSGRFPLTGRGDINTYTVFSELARMLIQRKGRCGIIVPSGIATDDTTKFFFQDLMNKKSLISFYHFDNRFKLFPAVGPMITFSLLTISNVDNFHKNDAEFICFAQKVSDLCDNDRYFKLSTEDIVLLNPNTKTCPIFRTQADAELTKAIYRRVPVLWREAKEDRPEENPWKLHFKTLFHMANDSHHFRTAEELRAEGYSLEGNVFVNGNRRYLPLYEAKMVHQFDHRWATYDAPERSRDVTLEEKKNPQFVVQPRYWVKDETVEAASPKYPEPLAAAIKAKDKTSIQHVLYLWTAGYYLLKNDSKKADHFLQEAQHHEPDRTVLRALPSGSLEDNARFLAEEFSLPDEYASFIEEKRSPFTELAAKLVDIFSPKWFLGWRDICRSTDERTLISCVIPKTGVGHKFMLIFPLLNDVEILCFNVTLNSIITDYVARQKLGSTSFSYFVLKQIPIILPQSLQKIPLWNKDVLLIEWIRIRAIEIIFTSQDQIVFAQKCSFHASPFTWDEDRRFEIRCELDAAFFHLYLPSENNGSWLKADGESDRQLADLKSHFNTPREAVDYVLEQFPIVKRNDEAAYGCYRTKQRILEIYDAMLEAQRSGQPYQTKLDPPPGVQL